MFEALRCVRGTKALNFNVFLIPNLAHPLIRWVPEEPGSSPHGVTSATSGTLRSISASKVRRRFSFLVLKLGNPEERQKFSQKFRFPPGNSVFLHLYQ